MIQDNSRDLIRKAKSILVIDPDRLDEECDKHADLYFDFSIALAEAKEELERVESNGNLVAADIDRDIRRTPEIYGMETIREAAVKAAILRHEKYKKAQSLIVTAKREVNILTAAVKALEHKKSMLGHRVSLFIAGYFARPKAVNDVGAKKFTGKKKPK